MTMKRRNFSGLLLMILGLIASAAGVVMLFFLPGGCDYVLPAPSFSLDTPVANTLSILSEELMIPWSADLRQQDAQVSSARISGQPTTVYGVSEGFFDNVHVTLQKGRLLNLGDFSATSRVAMINRKGAETLFPGLEPLGQTIWLGSTPLEIVGVTAGSFQWGEAQDLLLYVPMTLANSRVLLPQTMEIRIVSNSAEIRSQFASVVRTLLPGGTLLDHSRLRLAALMPLWLIGCVIGFCVLKAWMHVFRRLAVTLYRQTKGEQQTCYVTQLLPRIAARSLLALILLGLWLGAAYLLLKLIAYPLYTFTDWIPESPVDPASVLAAARNLLTAGAVSAVYKTRTAVAAEFCAVLIRAGCLLFLCGLIPRIFFRRKKWEIRPGPRNGARSGPSGLPGSVPPGTRPSPR